MNQCRWYELIDRSIQEQVLALPNSKWIVCHPLFYPKWGWQSALGCIKIGADGESKKWCTHPTGCPSGDLPFRNMNHFWILHYKRTCCQKSSMQLNHHILLSHFYPFLLSYHVWCQCCFEVSYSSSTASQEGHEGWRYCFYLQRWSISWLVWIYWCWVSQSMSIL